MTTKSEHWDNFARYRLREAYGHALSSTDKSTQNGAIIISKDYGKTIAWGWNDPVASFTVNDLGFGQHKYDVTEHAERNAIYLAARWGLSLAGTTMVCPWAACPDCAKAIVQSGITTLVRHKDAIDKTPERWAEKVSIGDAILKAGGVDVLDLEGPVGAPSSIRFDSETFWP